MASHCVSVCRVCCMCLIMRLICFWCFLVAAVRAQGEYYAPQTFRQHVGGGSGPSLFRPLHRSWDTVTEKLDGYQPGLFSPANDGAAQSTAQYLSPNSAQRPWKGPDSVAPQVFPKSEPWRLPFAVSKEQQAAILHHKQALTSEGSFRFEYASDNGLAAGETIEPDGSRVGAYQYKDPNGQVVKLKYRAGKEGFQILEGSHLPKSPEPVAPPTSDNHYQNAYAQQRQQYELQQQYNQQQPDPSWTQQQRQGNEDNQKGAGGQYFIQSWRPGVSQAGPEDDGQYRENEVENKGPHSFGTGYAFSFNG